MTLQRVAIHRELKMGHWRSGSWEKARLTKGAGKKSVRRGESGSLERSGDAVCRPPRHTQRLRGFSGAMYSKRTYWWPRN